jgi:hypothetical protein
MIMSEKAIHRRKIRTMKRPTRKKELAKTGRTYYSFSSEYDGTVQVFYIHALVHEPVYKSIPLKAIHLFSKGQTQSALHGIMKTHSARCATFSRFEFQQRCPGRSGAKRVAFCLCLLTFISASSLISTSWTSRAIGQT